MIVVSQLVISTGFVFSPLFIIINIFINSISHLISRMSVIAPVQGVVTETRGEDAHVTISSSNQYRTGSASLRTVSPSRPSSQLRRHSQSQQDRSAIQERIIHPLEAATYNSRALQIEADSTTVRTVQTNEELIILGNPQNTSIENDASALDGNAENENLQFNASSAGEIEEINSNHSSNRQLRRMGGQREQMWETTGDDTLQFDMNTYAEVVDMRLKPHIETCGFILGAVIGPMAFYVETAIPTVSADLFRRLWFRRGASHGLPVHIVLVVLCFGSLTWSLVN